MLKITFEVIFFMIYDILMNNYYLCAITFNIIINMNLRIKEICKAKGVTITQLATDLNIKQESLSRAINGNPTVETLEKIAVALGVPISALFSDSVQTSLNCPECGVKLKLVKDE